ncbi:MAG TPA: GFA family protein [Stellaceae bacterium]|nr:GFA family protein [Stellaceae bacterium]
MSTPMTGGCLCGAVRYESSGEPVFALLCHCRDCQRQSGSAYNAALRVPAAGFRVTRGAPKLYVKTADSGNTVTRAFCPECGSPLFLRVSARPDLVGIRVGTLDDPSGFRPEADIFVKSAQPWDHMNPELPKYPAYPPGKAYEPGA